MEDQNSPRAKKRTSKYSEAKFSVCSPFPTVVTHRCHTVHGIVSTSSGKQELIINELFLPCRSRSMKTNFIAIRLQLPRAVLFMFIKVHFITLQRTVNKCTFIKQAHCRDALTRTLSRCIDKDFQLSRCIDKRDRHKVVNISRL